MSTSLPKQDFFSKYFNFVSDSTESPITYHRWSAITAIGAILEKRYYFPHGHNRINPNLYTMIIGSAGTRKSTAIKLITSLVQESGYYNIAADKTTKEKFLEDLASINDIKAQKAVGYSSFLDAPLGGSQDPASVLISADEFNDFAGIGNLEFYSLLGTLWDKKGDYDYKTKAGDTVIPDPVVTMLGGNTSTGFAEAFPPNIIGQGFFSRMLLIYGEPTGVKIAFPEDPCPALKAEITQFLTAIRVNVTGKASITPKAKAALKDIYENYQGIPDPRFESYSNRRFNQLIKLCLIHSAARLDTEITMEDVMLSNTVLTYTEEYMPKALGEFGKASDSDTKHKIMVALDNANEPLTMTDLWKFASSDLKTMADLADIVRSLVEAQKIQKVDTAQGGGLLPYKKVKDLSNSKYVNYELLTEEEQHVSY